jgi:hypothetical protein
MPTIRNEVDGAEEPSIVGVSARYTGVWGETHGPASGVYGSSQAGYGVHGDSRTSAGVRGSSVDGRGTEGYSVNTEGVVGASTNGTGVWGLNQGAGTGVLGSSKSGTGVLGASETGPGVFGQSKSGRGVQGGAETNYGVTGDSRTFAGVRGTSVEGRGVEGWSTSGAGLAGMSEHDLGLYAKGGRLAGLFDGDVEVTGDIRLANADCAEDFDIAGADAAEPGTVMVLGDGGALEPSRIAYDRRVAGVISGAGDYKPGIVLDTRAGAGNRSPVALLGKVFCKADASRVPIQPGDLLTTSDTPGHAMRAEEQQRAFGAVIGKALRPLPAGRGLIPILIALQ